MPHADPLHARWAPLGGGAARALRDRVLDGGERGRCLRGVGAARLRHVGAAAAALAAQRLGAEAHEIDGVEARRSDRR